MHSLVPLAQLLVVRALEVQPAKELMVTQADLYHPAAHTNSNHSITPLLVSL